MSGEESGRDSEKGGRDILGVFLAPIGRLYTFFGLFNLLLVFYGVFILVTYYEQNAVIFISFIIGLLFVIAIFIICPYFGKYNIVNKEKVKLGVIFYLIPLALYGLFWYLASIYLYI